MILRDIPKSISLNTHFYKERFEKGWFYFFRFTMIVLFLYSIFFFFVNPKNKIKQTSPSDLLRSYFGGRLPQFIIKDGVITCKDLEQPYFSPRIRNFNIVVDTSGSIKTLKENVPSGLLIANQYFLLKLNYKKKFPIPASQINQIFGTNPIIFDENILQSIEPFMNKLLIPLKITSDSWKQTWVNFLIIFALSGILFYLIKWYKMKISYKNILKILFLTLSPGLCLTLLLVALTIPENIAIFFQTIFMGIISFTIIKKQNELL